MKKIFIASAVAAVLLASCGNNNKSEGDYPKNFKKIGDAGRIAYMMGRVKPDSLARFVVYGSLGMNPGAPIDTLATAVLYASEHLKGDDQTEFFREFENLSESLPLADKMKIYAAAGMEDPQGLGFKLGLEYIGRIREDNKKMKEIDAELAEFKKACANDSDTYRRFVVGFKVALQEDHGKDLSEEIYQKYINMPDE